MVRWVVPDPWIEFVLEHENIPANAGMFFKRKTAEPSGLS